MFHEEISGNQDGMSIAAINPSVAPIIVAALNVVIHPVFYQFSGVVTLLSSASFKIIN